MTRPRPDRPTHDSPCTGCGKPTRSTSRRCRACTSRLTAADRPRYRCGLCSAVTQNQERVCVSCQPHVNAAENDQPRVADGLYGGRWIPRNGVQIWQAVPA